MKKILLVCLSIVIVCSVLGYFVITNNNDKNSNQTNEKLATNSNETNKKIDLNKVVHIKDPELEKIIRNQILKTEGDILVSDMQQINSLNIDNKNTPVYEIDGLEYAVNLRDFSYRYGNLKSMNPIISAQKLSYMVISYSKVEEIPDEFNTPVLRSVSIIETNLSNCEFLKEAKKIVNLNITRSGLTSINFLSDMNDLETLDLSTNKISDIISIKNKTKLTDLSLHQNEVSNIDVISTCVALQNINISYNHVTNIKPLFELKNLIDVTAYEELDKKIIDRGQIQEFINKGVNVDYHK